MTRTTLPANPPPPEADISPPLIQWAPAIALALITLAIFWPVQTFEFINFDDPDYVSSNPMVQAGFTRESIHWAFTSAHSSNWHPVTWMAHMLDCQWFGLKAGPHHLVNVAFHLANTLLLLGFLRHTTGRRWCSLIVAGLFALHPLHVESVAWVSERKDVLSTFFGLLSLWAYAAYVKQSNVQSSKSKARYLAALVLFAFGLMSKPMLVTWPCVLLLMDFWPLRRMDCASMTTLRQALPKLLLEKIPFVALAAVSSFITVVVQRDAGATISFDALPLGARLAHGAVAYVRYLGKTFWPEPLAIFYPYQQIGWGSPGFLASILLLAALTIWVVRAWRRSPFLAFGWFWFLGTLVPVIGLVQVGRQEMADRYTYVPLIGLFIACVWWVADVAERGKVPAWVRAVAATAMLGACAALTSRQLVHWRDTVTLAAHTVRATEDNYVAHGQLAGALAEAGQHDEAEKECRTALRSRPGFAEAHNTLGNIHARQGKLEAAVASYREAARLDLTLPDPHHGLAELASKAGHFPEAEAHSRETLRLAPLHVAALFLLAQSLHNQGKLDEAIAAYQKLDALKPGLFSIHRGLGSLYVLKGNPAAAIREFNLALAVQPTNADAHNSMGLILLSQGEVLQASNHFARALQSQPSNAIANLQIAQLLNADRKSSAAAKHYRAALAAHPDWPEALNNFAWLLAASSDPSARNGQEAVRLAEQACALTGQKEPLLIGTLAAALAEAGRFTEAVAAADRAIVQARGAGLTNLVLTNEKLRELYRAGKPFHESQ